MHILSDKNYNGLVKLASTGVFVINKVYVCDGQCKQLKELSDFQSKETAEFSALTAAATKYTKSIEARLVKADKKNCELANALTIQSAITAMYERSIPEIKAKSNRYRAEIKRLNGLLTPVKTTTNSKPVNKGLDAWVNAKRIDAVLNNHNKKSILSDIHHEMVKELYGLNVPVPEELGDRKPFVTKNHGSRTSGIVAVIGTTDQCNKLIEKAKPSDTWYVIITSLEDACSESIRGVVFDDVVVAYTYNQIPMYRSIHAEIIKRLKK